MLAVVLAFTCASTVATDAHAQAGTPQWKVKKDAKDAYMAGKEAFGTGDYSTALEHFQEAESLYPGAAPKYQIALCYDKLGKVDEAIAAYRTFINSNPSEKYADRVVAAGQRISELESSVEGTIVVMVGPPEASGVFITVDGQPAEGTELKLSPGEHTLEITAEGYEPLTQTVTAEGGKTQELEVTLVPKASVSPDPVEPPDGEGPSGLKIAGFAVLGVAAVSGIVMTVFGVQALSASSDFEETPTEELADDAEDNGLIADIFLGITAAAAIGGAVMLAIAYSGDGEEETETGAMPKIAPYAGPEGGGGVVTWSF